MTFLVGNPSKLKTCICDCYLDANYIDYLNQDEVNRGVMKPVLWTHVKSCRAMNFVCLGFDRLKQDV